MKCDAIVFDREFKTFDVRSRNLARPDDAVFRARVLSTGVCGTDLQVLRGERQVEAMILGHEGLLQITDTLSLDCPFTEGALVVVNPTHPTIPDLVIGHSRDGLFARHFYGRRVDLDADAVISFPADLPRLFASLVEPLAVALLATELACSFLSQTPTRAIVVGAGCVGLCIAQHLANTGVAVDVMDVSPSRVEYVNGLRRSNIRAMTYPQRGTQQFDAAFFAVPPVAAIGAWERVAPLLASQAVADFVCDVPRRGEYVALHDVRRTVLCGRRAGDGFVLRYTGAGLPIKATGHRGVGANHIRSAIALLSTDPERFHPLVTHCVTPEEFCEIAREHRDTGRRSLSGREWVKMNIDWSDVA